MKGSLHITYYICYVTKLSSSYVDMAKHSDLMHLVYNNFAEHYADGTVL